MTRKNIKAVKYNFWELNHLPYEGRLFFAHSGIDKFLRIAGKILEKRVGPAETYKLDRPYLSENGEKVLLELIVDVLRIIGKHSNSRFGSHSWRQNAYFLRPSERSTFPLHLYMSRWDEKARQLKKKNKIEQGEMLNPDGPLYSKDAFKQFKSAHKVRFGRNQLTESETNAVGVFYTANLAWKTIQETQLKRLKEDGQGLSILAPLSQIAFDIAFFFDGSSQIQGWSKGGNKANKKAIFEEETLIIKKLVADEPTLPTNILVSRAKQRIEKEGTEKVPSEKWIGNAVRKEKKILKNRILT